MLDNCSHASFIHDNVGNKAKGQIKERILEGDKAR